MSLPSPLSLLHHLPLPSARTRAALTQLPKARSVPQALDAAMQVSGQSVDSTVTKLIRANEDDTPISTLQQQATDHYVRRASLLSGLVGAGAAFPGVGTAAATGLTVADLASFYANTTTYVLVMARLQGIDPGDKERRRLLVLTALLGDHGRDVLTSQLGVQTLLAARKQLTGISGPTAKAINKRLMKYVSKKAAAATAKRSIGRFIPFGIGAAFGYFSGRKVAGEVVDGLRQALGQPRVGTAATVRAEMSAGRTPASSSTPSPDPARD